MKESLVQIIFFENQRYHLKITESFHTEEDNSRIVPKTPRTVITTTNNPKLTIGITKIQAKT